MTTIELSEKDAEKFKLFMEHYDNIIFLLEKGVFDKHTAQIELHRNRHGIINEIHIQHRFRRDIDKD